MIGAPVTWTVVDDSTLRARDTNAGQTIEAVLICRFTITGADFNVRAS